MAKRFPAPAPPLRLDVDRPGRGLVVVAVSGEVDALTAPRLEEMLTNRLRGSIGSLIVNLTDVTFLGTAGLTVLLRARLRAEVGGVGFWIVTGQSQSVLRALEALGLTDRLPTTPDIQAALARAVERVRRG
ncbi:MAG TPA: STAS domain-containing protein [Actinophytocola sp.]|nr:STAS domain-containing protein [Actinophytocola sp.]